MTTASPLYGTPAALTITLASLASSAVDVGRGSVAIDQKDVSDAIDVLLGGKITVGTTPTINTQIEVWLYSSWDDVEYSGGNAGTDSATTATSLKTNMVLFAIIPVPVTTSDKAYTFGPKSVAQAFGGVIPVQWGVFVTHNTGVNLNATGGNHEVFMTTVKYESA